MVRRPKGGIVRQYNLIVHHCPCLRMFFGRVLKVIQHRLYFVEDLLCLEDWCLLEAMRGSRALSTLAQAQNVACDGHCDHAGNQKCRALAVQQFALQTSWH